MKRIEDPGEYTHFEEIGFFNRLIIDLKLVALGKPPSQPLFDVDRLNEGTKHIRKLMECRKKTFFK